MLLLVQVIVKVVGVKKSGCDGSAPLLIELVGKKDLLNTGPVAVQ